MCIRCVLRRLRFRSPRRGLLVGVASLAGLLGAGLVAGQSSENYSLTRSVITGGGASDSEGYAVTAALGQAEADPEPASSERYLIRGGFFTAQSAELSESLFSDGFEE